MFKVILLSGNNNEESKWMKRLSPPEFDMTTCHIDNPTYFDGDLTSYYIIESLKKEYDPESYILIIKDNSICPFSKRKLFQTLREITRLENWDFCYLSTWLQDINQLKVVAHIGNQHIIYKSNNPEGFQAVFISPHGQSSILGKNNMSLIPLNQSLYSSIKHHTKNKDITSLVIFPPLFNFNPMNIERKKDIPKFSFFSYEKKCKNFLPNYIIFVVIFFMVIALFITKRK